MKGMIIMWAGNIEDIPDNWQLCDGTNGTPNMNESFVKGSIGDQNTGTSGGNSIVAIDVSNLPEHTHSWDGDSYTEYSGEHSHTINVGKGGVFATSMYSRGGPNPTGNIWDYSGNHNHSVTLDGGNKSMNIRPNYYRLAFIMCIAY